VQLACPIKTFPQALAATKSPLTICARISVSALSPVFVSVTVCATLVVPTCCAAKLNINGDSPSVAPAAPIPVNDAICVPAESVIEKTPVLEPATVGVNPIATVQPVLAANLAPQVFAVMAKSPVIAGVCSVAETPPVLDTAMFWTGLAELPNVTVPKLRLVGVRTIAAGAAPTPLSAAVACPPGMFPSSVSVPVLVPVAVGAKTTCTAQLAPAASDTRVQLSVSVKSLVTATLLMINDPPPAFVTVTVCAADDCPAAVAGKLSAAGARPASGGATPTPVNATDCVRNASDTVKAPVSVPPAAGINSTVSVQLECPASETPQLFPSVKFPLAIPALISVNASSPAFVSVTVCAADTVPYCCDPKLKASGDSVSVGVDIPVPVSPAV